MNFSKLLFVFVLVNLVFLVQYSSAENSDFLMISKIEYTEKQISELSEIQIYASKNNAHNEQFNNKVDELIDLLEAHKKAEEQGKDIDRIQETVDEISDLLEEKKAGSPKFSFNEFNSSICFKCHTTNDFSPSAKTQKQWRRLIEDNGHSVFAKISWESPFQKKQVLEFLLENAGTYRAEGIGLWN